ncbi:hypothetical protein B0H21DRAFT_685928 [Amylocystis lapponica]|nr:hypothetical protein B0H21DRAFT_685928 [Amylocystis lapponica]
MSRHVITFPPPPPTHNSMSAEQRAQLMRTSTKLGQVLGSTPHVVDASYPPALRLDIPNVSEGTPKRKLFFSHLRSKSLPAIPDAGEEEHEVSPISASSGTSSSSHISTSSKTSSASARSPHSWRSPFPAQHPPLLKIVKPSHYAGPTDLSLIPGSPPAYSPLPSPPVCPDAPTFTVPSEASLRRDKMRRLTRRLGDGVPQELVFPETDADVDEDADDEAPLFGPRASQPGSARVALTLTTRYPDGSALPSIPEGRAAQPRSRHDMSVPTNAKGKSQTRKTDVQAKSSRNAIYVIDGPVKRGSRSPATVCLGVSASAGMHGMGKTRRWVQGPIPFDQIVGAW